MKISLIIAFYKNITALELILLALEKQTYSDFEIIVAEDDNDPKTVEFIGQMKTKHAVRHVSHEDKGFRKNKILNEAIKISTGDFIVFIDGDCIPHRNFLNTYAKLASETHILFGRRVMLSEKLTEELYTTKDLKQLNLMPLLKSKSKKIKYSFNLPILRQIRKEGIVGANWGLYKKHLMAVNGFDEDYVTAGVGEDNDIEWRLLRYGLRLKSVRFSAVLYHLFHKSNYSSVDTSVGYRLLAEKTAAKEYYCKNGILKQP